MVIASATAAASSPPDSVTEGDELEDQEGDHLVVVAMLEAGVHIATVHVASHVLVEEEDGHQDADALGSATTGGEDSGTDLEVVAVGREVEAYQRREHKNAPVLWVRRDARRRDFGSLAAVFTAKDRFQERFLLQHDIVFTIYS